MKCHTLNELMDYTCGLLADEESARIKSHILAECEDCLGNLRWLEEVARLARQDRSFDFPEKTIKDMVAWFKSQPAHSPPSVRKLIAKLTFDSLLPNQFVTVRGDLDAGHSIIPAAGRQMLFQTEGYDIDLRIEPIEDDPTIDLLGQILPQNETEAIHAGVTVSLWHNEKEQMSVKTDNQGFFRFSQTPLRVYDLKIQVAEVEIDIVDLSAERPT